jgi:protein-S-isoprenylcysteine O-methyltransferase Ste14
LRDDSTYAERLVRLRVPLTWALGLAAIVLARPTAELFSLGLIIAALGEALRIWAAGHLVKGGEVTRSGPYSWTRNPLYLGSSLMGLGFCIAAGRWELGALLGILLFGVYRPVILTEAEKLAERFPEDYAAYAKTVPLFFPVPWRRGPGGRDRGFSWERVWANREYKAAAGWLAVVLLLWSKMQWIGQ